MTTLNKDQNWLMAGSIRWLFWQVVSARGTDGLQDDDSVEWDGNAKLLVKKDGDVVHLIYMLGHLTVNAEFDLTSLQLNFQDKYFTVHDSSIIYALSLKYVNQKL